MQSQTANFVRVVIPWPLKQPLIYRVPPDLRDQLSPGMRVLAPLGRLKVTGVVFELLAETSLSQTKQILSILDEQPIIDGTLVQLSRWMAQYYVTTIGAVLGTVLPPGLRSESQRTIIAKPGTLSIDDPVANR